MKMKSKYPKGFSPYSQPLFYKEKPKETIEQNTEIGELIP